MEKYTIEELAFLQLFNDPLFNKIPKSEYHGIVRQSIEIGKTTALKVRDKEIKTLLKTNNITINEKKERRIGKVQLRGEVNYSDDGSEIMVYEESLNSLVSASINGTSNEIDHDIALNMHLAHEYYHFLEFFENGLTSEKVYHVENPSLFNRQRKCQLISASEIAAHSFSYFFCQLRLFPNAYDYLLLIREGKMTKEDIDEICELYKN